MNVLIVHNFYQQAGGEDQVFADETTLLKQNGHIVARYMRDNDDVEKMGRFELARKTIWNGRSYQSLRRAIREIRADVVHFHNTFPLISPSVYYAAHKEGAAVVQTLHNYRLLCPGATFYRDGGVCEKCTQCRTPWPAVIHRCYRKNLPASFVSAAMLTIHRAMRTYRDKVDAYIALTDFAKRKFVAGGLPEDKIIVKPNFVDPDPGIGEGEGNFVLFVGRLTEEKGIPLLLKSWNSLSENRGCQLKIIGDGPLAELVSKAAKENGRIEYLGRRAPAEVYAMMGSAKALMFPSQWYEGQPRTILESFAKGTPVIASRLGSMTEMIQHGQTGLLFEPGSVENLVWQAKALIESTDEDRARMRRAARMEFESRYTAQQNYPMLIRCYEKALSTLRSPAAAHNAGSGVLQR